MELSQDQVRLYRELQENPTASEAYVFARRYGLSLSLAGIVISKFNDDVTKAIKFTEFYKSINGSNWDNYPQEAEIAAKNDFSFIQKDLSILEQEVMNFETRYNLSSAISQIKVLEKEGKLEEVKSRSKDKKRDKFFRFHPTDLDSMSDYLGRTSSHHDEHNATRALDR